MADQASKTFQYIYDYTQSTAGEPLFLALQSSLGTILTIVLCLVIASYVRRLVAFIWSLAINVIMALVVASVAAAVFQMGPEQTLRVAWDKVSFAIAYGVELAKFFWSEWEKFEQQSQKSGKY